MQQHLEESIMATTHATKHVLMPTHTLLNDKEKEKVLSAYAISANQLPKILINDPAIASLDPKVGDVIRVDRTSYTMGKTAIYRVVANG